VDLTLATLRYFFMIGNGLGANIFLSGNTSRGVFITNDFDFLYAARIEIINILDMLSIGGHYNFNEHDNIAYNSGRAMYDFHRVSYSGDATLTIPYSGLSVKGMLAEGFIDDDYYGDGKRDMQYSGYELTLLWDINALTESLFQLDILPKLDFFSENRFSLGFRFDEMKTEADESGKQIKQQDTTLGLNYHYLDIIKLQLNYIFKTTIDPTQPGLDDNILFIQIQLKA